MNKLNPLTGESKINLAVANHLKTVSIAIILLFASTSSLIAAPWSFEYVNKEFPKQDVTFSLEKSIFKGTFAFSSAVEDGQEIPNFTNNRNRFESILDISPYCEVSMGYFGSISEIKSVRLNNDEKAPHNPAKKAHQDYTHISMEMNTEVSYTLSLQSNEEAHFTVWIDWDGDGSFNNSDEIFKLGKTTSKNISETITVPPYAKVGNTRIRIILKVNQPTTDPCNPGHGWFNTWNGQVHDYTVNIKNHLAPINATATNITHNSANLNWIKAYGSTPTSYDIEWSDTNTFTGNPTVSGINATKYALSNLVTAKNYYYRVRAHYGSVKSEWSKSAIFRTGFYTPLEIKGNSFNHDVIANGRGSSSNTTSISFDAALYVFIEKNAYINKQNIAEGLPVNQVLKQQGFTDSQTQPVFFLQDYSGTNTLRLPKDQSGTLFLETPVAVSSLYLAGSSGSGNASLDIEVIYTTGVSQKFTNRALLDWFHGTPYFYVSSSRISRNSNSTAEYPTLNPRIYQLALEGLDPNRLVREIKITNKANGIANIFAVNGLNAEIICPEIFLSQSTESICTESFSTLTATSEATDYIYTWSPATGLYIDPELNTPYNGENRNQVYASPESNTTYTLKAYAAKGCASQHEIVVQRDDRMWSESAISSDWSDENNWVGNTIPTQNHCVKINANGIQPIIPADFHAYAKNLTVADGSKLTIQKDGSLTVTDFIQNGTDENNVNNFVIESGGSLMQINDNAINSGKITAKRTFTFSEDRKQYNYIISPLIGQSIKTIYEGAPFVIYHREDKNFFYNAGAGTYIPGRGLSIKESAIGKGAIQNVDAVMKGIPFNGELDYPVTYTPNPANDIFIPGFNLIGNPYPSNLDLDKFFNDNKGKIDGTFQFWDNRGNTIFTQQGSEYKGANYAKYNAVNGAGIKAADKPAESNFEARIPTKLVRPGTAFMVQTHSSGNVLNFNNSQRVAANKSPEFFGKNDDGSKNPSRYWLTLTTPNGVQYMTAVVYFWEGSNEFTIDDSESNGSSDDIYTLVGEEQIAIHGRAPFVKTDKVPLGVRLFEMGTYVIKLYDKEGIFANGQNIYIRDKKLKTTYNLTQADYKFIEGAGEINDRFEIIYNPNSLTAQNAASENASEISIEKKDKNIVVTSTSDKITQIEVYSLTGRSVFKKTGINTLEFKLPVNQFEKQIIVIHIETETGEVITKKFVNK